MQTALFSEGGMSEVAKAMQVLEDLMGQVANVTLVNLAYLIKISTSAQSEFWLRNLYLPTHDYQTKKFLY